MVHHTCRQCCWGSEFGTADRRSGMRVSYKWVPSVRQDCCAGCGVCGAVCPHGCLAVVDGTGALVRPEACTSEASCVSACGQRAIYMAWATVDSDYSVGRWRSA